MPDISVQFDTVPFQKAIKAAYSNQFPYAVSQALNEVAFAALRERMRPPPIDAFGCSENLLGDKSGST